MQNNCTEGYLIRKNLRIYYFFSVSIAIGGFALFAILMWYESFQPQNTHSPYMDIAIIFSGLSLFIVTLTVWNIPIMRIKYACRNTTAINFQVKKEKSLDLTEGCFLARAQIPFAIGYGKMRESFFLLASKPLPNADKVTSGGIPSIKFLIKADILVLPDNVYTYNWIVETTGVTAISDYPRAMFIKPQRRQKTGDGSAVSSQTDEIDHK